MTTTLEHKMTDARSPHAVLEEAGVAFDPTTQHLDLSKDEKRRTTALLMAINAYQHLIIKEAAYLKEAADLARRDEGPKLQPATIDAMVEAAIKFDMFIEGQLNGAVHVETREPEGTP
jgi:hypothetical protein